MQIQQIIGADLSKKTIDLASHFHRTHFQILNSEKGFKALLKWIKDQKMNSADVLIVMEHTGLYSYCFEAFLHQHHIKFTKVNALAIKRSLGLIRGKNDKIDAIRIAAYGHEKMHQLSIQATDDEDLKRLQLLYSTRLRLVKQRAALSCAIKEYRNIGLTDKDVLIASQLQLIKALDKQIEKIESEAEKQIKKQEKVKNNYKLLQSIKGVGKVLALNTIIKTENFTRFINARKFACYCGTAPFEHTSGSSIKGRTRVSHLADKQMKSLLDLAAKTAIQHDKEMKEFYLRRLESGKSKMSTINIVRNKIIYRMFAVIKRQTVFTENYLQVA